ncbi:ROK family protein [Ligilactobacillus equi]
MTKLYGAIEAGGTKFVCAVSDADLNIVERVQILTTVPAETMAQVFEFFDKYTVEAIAIGSFGPIDVNKNSATYGYVTTTPKKGWANYNFLGDMKAHYDVPYVWTTDVNVAAYGELKRGAAKGCQSCLYLTVGTGMGGGAVVNGKVLEGFGHPEMGHITMRRHPEDKYEGYCIYHKDCLEGLTCGPAVEERAGGVKAYDIPKDAKDWEIEAYYLAQACMDYTLILSPEKIVFGGGVSKQEQLFPMIRESFKEQMKDYVATPDLDDYIVHVELGDDAGITGCLLLAMEEAAK